MPKYNVCVRGIAHLTKEICIKAANSSDARIEALRMAKAFDLDDWDESEPEDVRIESIEVVR